jgi:hypothetical protein
MGPVEGYCEHGDEPSGSLKLLGVSWVAARLAASQEGLSSVHKYVSTKFPPSGVRGKEVLASLGMLQRAVPLTGSDFLTGLTELERPLFPLPPFRLMMETSGFRN